jgi:hypothetical protein
MVEQIWVGGKGVTECLRFVNPCVSLPKGCPCPLLDTPGNLVQRDGKFRELIPRALRNAVVQSVIPIDWQQLSQVQSGDTVQTFPPLNDR